MGLKDAADKIIAEKALKENLFALENAVRSKLEAEIWDVFFNVLDEYRDFFTHEGFRVEGGIIKSRKGGIKNYEPLVAYYNGAKLSSLDLAYGGGDPLVLVLGGTEYTPSYYRFNESYRYKSYRFSAGLFMANQSLTTLLVQPYYDLETATTEALESMLSKIHWTYTYCEYRRNNWDDSDPTYVKTMESVTFDSFYALLSHYYNQ